MSKLKVLICFDSWLANSFFLTVSLHGRKSSSVPFFSYKGCSSIGPGLTLMASLNLKPPLKGTNYIQYSHKGV